MNKSHRILALVGIVMIVAAVLTMLVSGFVPTLRDLLLNISLLCTCLGATVLVVLLFLRKRQQEKVEDEEPQA